MDQLGPYELLEQIGRGGMGAVFRARDSRDGRPVAIKLLHGGGAANQTWRKRFEREAAALARVQHPHVVRAVGFDSAPSGEPYLVMEWVAGESLQDRLDRGGALSPAEAVALAITLCEALAACHAAGILHRDLKPANVLVDRERGLKLTDFGLVRDTDPSTSRSALTRTGNMLGSPGYWAPEQALGQLERVGPATDVYGAGALLFGLLTTRPPQHGESLIEILRRATEPAPAPSSLNPEVPVWLDAVIGRALALRPEDRYPSVEELRDALAAGHAPGRRRALPPSAWLASVGLCLAGVAGAALVLRSPRAASTELEAQPERPSPPDSVDPAPAPAHPRVPPAGDAVATWQALGRESEGLLAEGRYREALARCDRAIAVWPEHPDAWVIRGRIRRALNDMPGALADFSEALRLEEGHAGALGQRGYTYGMLLQWQRAADDFERALAVGPDDAAQRQALESRLSIAREKVAGAARAGYPPDEPPAEVRALAAERSFDAGRALMSSGQVADAVEAFSQTIALEPDHAEALLERGLARCQLELFAAGIEDFDRAIAARPGESLLFHARGLARLNLDQLVEAHSDMTRAVQLQPDYALAYRYRGLVRARLGDLQGSVIDLERARRLEPQAAWAAEAQEALEITRARLRAPDAKPVALPAGVVRPFDASDPVDRARWHGSHGDFEAVLADLDPLLADGRGTFWAYYYRGTARVSLGDYQGALADANRAAELDPEVAGVFVIRGEVYAFLDDEERALRDFDRALELDPDHVDGLYDRAFLLGQREDYAPALRDLNHLIEVAPEHALAHSERGTFRARAGDLEGARADWSRALELAPDATWADGVRENLRVAQSLETGE